MIKVDERFYISASSNCYILQERTVVQDKESPNYGKELFKDLGYYTTIEDCLNGIFKVHTREFINNETKNSLKELQEEIQKYRQYLKSLNLDI